jgi:steroid delta-isomerase-like uncharacterized protein
MANEQNEQVVRRSFEEAWSKGDLDAVDETVSPEAVGYDPALPEPTRGTDGLKQNITMYRAAFPDLKLMIEDMISDGDKVVTRWTSEGTHEGELMGIPATGKHISGGGISIDRLEDGKIVEDWTHWDNLGLLRQLGVAEPAGAAAGR